MLIFLVTANAKDSNLLRVNFRSVHTNKYLVHLLVDGAETKPEVDDNLTSRTYQWYNHCADSLTFYH